MAYRVAVVGATGAVGREMLKTLAERRFPVAEVAAVASGRSAGQEVSFGEKQVLKVRNLETFDFTGWDIGLFSPGASVSAVHAPRAAAQGCVVIDNTSQFRMDPDVPLVVPEVNPQALRQLRQGHIIANPNCSTIQMVVALKPLHDELPRSSAWWSPPTSRSPAAGRRRWTSSFDQTKGRLRARARAAGAVHQGDRLQLHPAHRQVHGRRLDQGRVEDGGRDEEDPRSRHRRACHLRARAGVHRPRRGGERRVRDAGRPRARRAPACARRRASRWWMCARTAATSRRWRRGEDAVFVSRIRKDPTVENGLNFWCVSDNLRKGAALNAVQIAETLVAQGLLVKQAA